MPFSFVYRLFVVCEWRAQSIEFSKELNQERIHPLLAKYNTKKKFNSPVFSFSTALGKEFRFSQISQLKSILIYASGKRKILYSQSIILTSCSHGNYMQPDSAFKALLHCTMFRATCLAMALRDNLHETLHSVTSHIGFYFLQRFQWRCTV